MKRKRPPKSHATSIVPAGCAKNCRKVTGGTEGEPALTHSKRLKKSVAYAKLTTGNIGEILPHGRDRTNEADGAGKGLPKGRETRGGGRPGSPEVKGKLNQGFAWATRINRSKPSTSSLTIF